jgi:hypothetical protein
MTEEMIPRSRLPGWLKDHFGIELKISTYNTYAARELGPAYRRVGGRCLYPTTSLQEWAEGQISGTLSNKAADHKRVA